MSGVEQGGEKGKGNCRKNPQIDSQGELGSLDERVSQVCDSGSIAESQDVAKKDNDAKPLGRLAIIGLGCGLIQGIDLAFARELEIWFGWQILIGLSAIFCLAIGFLALHCEVTGK